MAGWIKVHRQLTEWEWYRDSSMVHLFLHLLLKANHEDKTWQGKLVKRGQLVTGLHALVAQTNITIRTLRTCLSRLEKSGEIDKQTTNKFTIITICKYEEYNSDRQTENQESTNERQTSDKQTTTNKNVKNNKEVKNKEDTLFPENEFSVPDPSDIPSENTGTGEQKAKDVPKVSRRPPSPAHPAYQPLTEFWLKEFHPGWTFGAIQGTKLKAIIKKLEKFITDSGRVSTTGETVEAFKLVCYNLPDWYKDKDLPTIDSKFNEIITQIKSKADGQSKFRTYADGVRGRYSQAASFFDD